MIAEYLGKVGYKGGKPLQGFLVSIVDNIELIKKNNKKIALLGCGVDGFFAEKLLNDFGIKIDYYADNSEKLQGNKMGGGKKIFSPYKLFSQDVYFIIAVPKGAINCARQQLVMHGVETYSIFMIAPFYDFVDTDLGLQNKLMDSINDIAFAEDTLGNSAPLGSITDMGVDSQFGCLNFLLHSTEWSHWAYQWEQQVIKEQNMERILEVGPGYGLMSLVLLREFGNIYIDWLIFGNRNNSLTENVTDPSEKGLWKVKQKYNDRVNAIYGFIEKDDNLIEEKYNLIIMTEVFEHFVLNPVNTMKRLKNMLKQGGKLILTTPNWGHLHIYESWKELPNTEDVNDIDYAQLCQLCKVEHTYQYTKNELYDIFGEAGFEVVNYCLSSSNNHNFMLSVLD